ncbi:methyltransferase type 12 [Devosia sp. Leaf64]|nr:methyltransferase type 12 [Devosia sp. Leaf64]
MSLACRTESGWQISAPEPVGSTETLFERLAKRKRENGALLLGVDFSIGLPAAYAKAAGITGFREFLNSIGKGKWPTWLDVATTPEEIGIHRPFYPARPGSAKRAHLLDALGLTAWDDLLRLCERASKERPAAASLFWTMGGNQVGKAAISGWQELIIPNLDRIALWPFDGPLHELVRTNDIVIAETYPGDIYSQIGFPKRGWSKRKQGDRVRFADSFAQWFMEKPHVKPGAILPLIATGFGEDPHAEDRFDSLVGLIGMIDVVDGGRYDGAPDTPQISEIEGWMLGHRRSG